MPLSKRIVYLHDYAAEAAKAAAEWGRTDRFSTGLTGLDRYLYGGFGKRWGWEVVVVFGPTKAGKSTFCLNMISTAVRNGDRVGIMALEDEGRDIYHRFQDILGEGGPEIIRQSNITMMSPEVRRRAWKLPELLEMLESWFIDQQIDLILLDHLQFAFENAEAIRGENEWIMQRKFMQEVNHLMSRVQEQKPSHTATLVLVSHVNKDEKAKGVAKIAGSSGIAAAATKIIEIQPAADGMLEVQLHPSRHTPRREGPFLVRTNGARLEAVSSVLI